MSKAQVRVEMLEKGSAGKIGQFGMDQLVGDKPDIETEGHRILTFAVEGEAEMTIRFGPDLLKYLRGDDTEVAADPTVLSESKDEELGLTEKQVQAVKHFIEWDAGPKMGLPSVEGPVTYEDLVALEFLLDIQERNIRERGVVVSSFKYSFPRADVVAAALCNGPMSLWGKL